MKHTIINIYLHLSDNKQLIGTSKSETRLILSTDNIRVQTEMEIGQIRPKFFFNSLYQFWRWNTQKCMFFLLWFHFKHFVLAAVICKLMLYKLCFSQRPFQRMNTLYFYYNGTQTDVSSKQSRMVNNTGRLMRRMRRQNCDSSENHEMHI